MLAALAVAGPVASSGAAPGSAPSAAEQLQANGDTIGPGVNGKNLKPRVIVQSDISSPDNEPDDIQSFVHLLSLADQYEIEAIIATTGYALLGSYNVDSRVNGVNFGAAPIVGVLNDLPGGDRIKIATTSAPPAQRCWGAMCRRSVD